jgi:hypothetical protein
MGAEGPNKAAAQPLRKSSVLSYKDGGGPLMKAGWTLCIVAFT